MSKTHPNFKSLVPTVSDIATINEYIGDLLKCQKNFCRTSTYEIKWNKK